MAIESAPERVAFGLSYNDKRRPLLNIELPAKVFARLHLETGSHGTLISLQKPGVEYLEIEREKKGGPAQVKVNARHLAQNGTPTMRRHGLLQIAELITNIDRYTFPNEKDNMLRVVTGSQVGGRSGEYVMEAAAGRAPGKSDIELMAFATGVMQTVAEDLDMSSLSANGQNFDTNAMHARLSSDTGLNVLTRPEPNLTGIITKRTVVAPAGSSPSLYFGMEETGAIRHPEELIVIMAGLVAATHPDCLNSENAN